MGTVTTYLLAFFMFLFGCLSLHGVSFDAAVSFWMLVQILEGATAFAVCLFLLLGK